MPHRMVFSETMAGPFALGETLSEGAGVVVGRDQHQRAIGPGAGVAGQRRGQRGLSR